MKSSQEFSELKDTTDLKLESEALGDRIKSNIKPSTPLFGVTNSGALPYAMIQNPTSATAITAAPVLAPIVALNANPPVNSITLTDTQTPTLNMTAEQAFVDSTTLNKITTFYNLAVVETASNIIDDFSTLQANGNCRSLTATLTGAFDWAIASGSNTTINLNGDHESATLSGLNCTVTLNGSFDAATSSGANQTANLNGEHASAMLSGSSSTATLNGDYETATISGSNSIVTLYGKHVSAMISGSHSTVTLNGDYETAMLFGSSSTATLNGDHEEAMISGPNSSVTLNGSFDMAILGGPNQMVILNGDHEIITGFDPTDKLQLSNTDFASWSDLLGHISQSGADTVIALGDANTITLKGVTATTLQSNQFKLS